MHLSGYIRSGIVGAGIGFLAATAIFLGTDYIQKDGQQAEPAARSVRSLVERRYYKIYDVYSYVVKALENSSLTYDTIRGEPRPGDTSFTEYADVDEFRRYTAGLPSRMSFTDSVSGKTFYLTRSEAFVRNAFMLSYGDNAICAPVDDSKMSSWKILADYFENGRPAPKLFIENIILDGSTPDCDYLDGLK